MKNLAITVALLVSLSGCHNPKSTVIPGDVDKWDSDLKTSMQELSDADRQTVTAFLVRAKMTEAFAKTTLITPGLTIGSAIEQQNKWVQAQKDADAEQEALKKKLLAEQAAIQKQIQSVVTVTVVSKILVPSSPHSGRYSDRQEFKLGIENKGNKDILGVKGTVYFFDIFEKEQGRVGFSFDDGIDVGKTKIWEGGRDYNQFLEAHRSLANLEEGKYHTKFVPEAIIFKDGTKITMPAQ